MASVLIILTSDTFSIVNITCKMYSPMESSTVSTTAIEARYNDIDMCLLCG